jgi:methionyl-tRNA formyltransferase
VNDLKEETHSFGSPKGVCFFGGTPVLSEVIEKWIDPTLKVEVVTCDAFLRELIHSQTETLEEFLKRRKIPYTSVSDLAKLDQMEGLQKWKEYIAFSVSSPWIFDADFIARFDGNFVNVHGSSLPQWKGGGGFSWQIMGRRIDKGISIHLLTPGLDDGDVIVRGGFEYDSSDLTPKDYLLKQRSKMADLVCGFLNDVAAGKSFRREQQSPSEGCYWPRLSTSKHGWIDWSWDRVDIMNFIRAFSDPYPGAQTFLSGKKIVCKKALLHKDECFFHPFQHGIAFRKAPEGIFVACRGGGLLLSGLYDESGKDISKNVRVGSRLHTPRETLESALGQKARFTSDRGIE